MLYRPRRTHCRLQFGGLLVYGSLGRDDKGAESLRSTLKVEESVRKVEMRLALGIYWQ